MGLRTSKPRSWFNDSLGRDLLDEDLELALVLDCDLKHQLWNRDELEEFLLMGGRRKYAVEFDFPGSWDVDEKPEISGFLTFLIESLEISLSTDAEFGGVGRFPWFSLNRKISLLTVDERTLVRPVLFIREQHLYLESMAEKFKQKVFQARNTRRLLLRAELIQSPDTPAV